MRMAIFTLVFPRKKRAERRPAMTVSGFLLSRELGESLANLGKVEERIVAESIEAARRTQDDAFGRPVKRRQRVAVARGSDHADESPGTEFVGHIVQLAQQPRIVGLVVGVGMVLLVPQSLP